MKAFLSVPKGGRLPTLPKLPILDVGGGAVLYWKRISSSPAVIALCYPAPTAASVGLRVSPRPSQAREPWEKQVSCPPLYSPYFLPPQSAPRDEIARNTPSRPRVKPWCLSMCADSCPGRSTPLRFHQQPGHEIQLRFSSSQITGHSSVQLFASLQRTFVHLEQQQ